MTPSQMKKNTLANAFEQVRHQITELSDSLMWQSWADATENGYAASLKKRRKLAQMEILVRDLGALVQGKMRVRKDGRRNEQGSRLLLAMCPECEYRIRVSAMCLLMGVPTCPVEDCKRFGAPFDYSIPEQHEENMERVNVKTFADEGETKRGESPMSQEEREFFEKAGEGL